jgi:8-oxo-dGTP pyrophosphatase MutT (NUDIX family)
MPAMPDDAPPPAIPAATVVLIRDGDEGLETLMLHRSSKVAFGGMWVFPGGRIDDEDRHPDDADEEASARRAAVREAIEECALVVDPAEVVAFSHWTPPPVTDRRYATWFFLAPVAPGEVVVDGSEMVDHRWLPPAEVLARRDRGEVDLAPPTWVTLHDLTEVADVQEAIALAGRRDPIPQYETHWVHVPDGGVTLWQGDAGYESGDLEAPGGRNRLWMVRSGWRLERNVF